ncbi:MAG: imidazolonepropionase [Elusimicrobiota bacterium]
MNQLIYDATLLTLAGPPGPRSGRDMGSLGIVRQGAVLMGGGKILAVGPQDYVRQQPEAKNAMRYRAEERVVMPGFVDSHTHPVFGAERLQDFALRVRGKSYEEIAEQGGGIRSSIHAMRGATEEELTRRLRRQARLFLECGTTTIEGKSGYGLDKDSELKALRVMRHAAQGSPLGIVPTFLGAHAVPPEYAGRSGDYVRMMCEEVLPVVAREELAVFVDAFCENGYFTPAETETFLRAGAKAGLAVKIHAEQLSHSGGAAVAGRLGAVSADHLDHVDDDDLTRLKASGTIAALVPGSNHFLGSRDYPPARRIIDADLPVALATDFNPGSCPCWNMQEIISIAATRMRMTPEEAITAATINGAYALGMGRTLGSLESGKAADVIVLDCRDYRELPYWFGANLLVMAFKAGNMVHARRELRDA